MDDLLPSNLDAEQALLGALILDPSYIDDVLQTVIIPDSFTSPSHQHIFQVLLTLFDRRVAIDSVTLREELSRQGLLEKVGGEDYLLTIMDRVPFPGNAPQYAKIIREKAVLRAIVQVCQQVMTAVHRSGEESGTILDQAEQLIFSLTHDKVGSDIVRIDRVVDAVFGVLEEMKNNRSEVPPHLTPTGYKDLDELISGFQPSQLVIIAGRPSMGKTSLAMSLAQNMALIHRKPLLFFTLETDQQQLVQNMLCSLSRINSDRLRKGFLSEDERGKLLMASGLLHDAPIFIDNSKSLTPLEIKAKARRMKALNNIQAVFIDYLQLVEVRAMRAVENRQQEIAFISRSLKSLARELEIPVIAMAQLSRAVDSREGHKPFLSDLRESGAIEQDADVVLLLYREDYYNRDTDPSGLCEVIVAKQRHGPTGSVSLTFLKDYMRFENAAPSE